MISQTALTAIHWVSTRASSTTQNWLTGLEVIGLMLVAVAGFIATPAAAVPAAAAISGVMKAFFDRCYYPCLGKIEGRPYAVIICAGSDGTNAARQAERIATGWRLRKIADALIICTHAQTEAAILAPKTIAEEDMERARQTGAQIAAGMALGIF